MLRVDIRSVEAHAVHIDGQLGPDDPVWEAGDTLPTGPIQVTGRLSSAGTDRFYWQGHLAGRVESACRRCLEPAVADVSEEASALFVANDDEESEDDPDIFRYDPFAGTIDLRAAVREQWVLSVPAFVACRDDCKGLCPTCGANLNAGACGCTTASDNRWDALRGKRGEFT